MKILKLTEMEARKLGYAEQLYNMLPAHEGGLPRKDHTKRWSILNKKGYSNKEIISARIAALGIRLIRPNGV